LIHFRLAHGVYVRIRVKWSIGVLLIICHRFPPFLLMR
jgi:hypothetical protein